MNWFDNFSISFAYSWIYFLIGIISIITYTIFVYKTTLPPVNNLKRFGLILLRSTALLLILLLIFDPVLKLTELEKIFPKTLVFIDNSKSINEFASSLERNEINKIISEINEQTDGNAEFYTFGSGNLKKFNLLSDSIAFNESSTDLSFLHDKISKTKNVSSVLIISDGIINQGPDPTTNLRNSHIPIFTLGIGDTNIYKDISVEKIIANSAIYADRETEIEILLRHENFTGSKSNIIIYDNDSLIYSESITLGSTGIERIRLPYKSASAGNHLIRVITDTNSDEKNKNNNSKTSLIKVLSTKKIITLIAGSPSADYTAIKQSIELNKDFEIKEIIEIGAGRYVKGKDEINSLNESDIIFLIGFPASTSRESFVNSVMNEISSKSIPIFICFSQSSDLNKFAEYESILPFRTKLISKKYLTSEGLAQKSFNNLLGSGEEVLNAWNSLPPVDLQYISISPSSSAEILLTSKVNNEPIIFVNGTGKLKSIVLTASNIWKWKIKAPNKNFNLFNNFILNSLRWLSLQSNDFFNVSLDKNNFRSGEVIKFTANLYNTIFEPLSNERIILNLAGPSTNSEYLFSSLGNGLYELDLNLGKPGIYNYTVKVDQFSENYKPISGSFSIEPLEIELLNKTLNKNLLKSISASTSGEYFNTNKSASLINELSFNYQNKIYLNTSDNELRLSSFEFILLIIVLLLSIEWILRKVFKMI